MAITTTGASRIYAFYLLMVVVSVVLILAYQFFPERTLKLAPSSAYTVYTYGDGDKGGLSTAHFLDDKRQHWACSLKPGVPPPDFPSCRIGLSFSIDPDNWTAGVDLSGFDHLRIRLDYDGPATFFRAHFRNFDSKISTAEDYNSGKFINLIIRNPAYDSNFIFRLTEFKLADWWIQQYAVPNELAKASFEKITSFELDFGEPVPYGEHYIHLKSIELVGKYISAESWYLGILICWLIVIATTGMVRLRQLYLVSRRQQQRIQEMNEYAQELKEQSKNYRELSSHDQLTGAMNRLGLQHIIESSFDWRKANNQIALLLLDLDHFKRINDTEGHDAGDKALQSIATMLLNNVRACDTVARWGGEEFVLICPNTPAEAAMIMAEKIRVKISELTFSDNDTRRLTVSIGVTIIESNETFSKAFNRADNALYQAKNSGRNCWAFA